MIRGETVTLIRKGVATGHDPDCNDTFTPTETPAPGAVFTPAGSTETIQGREQVTDTPTFTWVDTVPSISALDQIRRADGGLYEVDGEPQAYSSPFSGMQVLVVRAGRVTG